MAILATSGRDWIDRTRRLGARVPGLDIFSQGLIERLAGGRQITEKGRAVLDVMEDRSADPLPAADEPSSKLQSPEVPALPVTVERDRRQSGRRQRRRAAREQARARFLTLLDCVLPGIGLSGITATRRRARNRRTWCRTSRARRRPSRHIACRRFHTSSALTGHPRESANRRRGLRTMLIKPRAPTKSWVLPGVIRKASGRPTSSVSAWILVVCPPRERPIALLKAPLCAGRGAMGFDVAGIYRHRSVHAGRSGQSVKNIRPNPLPAPAVEAIVDRV